MALTSTNHAPSTAPINTTPGTLAAVAIAWMTYYVALTWWRITNTRLEIRALHLVPPAFAVVVLLAAVIALGVTA